MNCPTSTLFSVLLASTFLAMGCSSDEQPNNTANTSSTGAGGSSAGNSSGGSSSDSGGSGGNLGGNNAGGAGGGAGSAGTGGNAGNGGNAGVGANSGTGGSGTGGESGIGGESGTGGIAGVGGTGGSGGTNSWPECDPTTSMGITLTDCEQIAALSFENVVVTGVAPGTPWQSGGSAFVRGELTNHVPEFVSNYPGVSITSDKMGIHAADPISSGTVFFGVAGCGFNEFDIEFVNDGSVASGTTVTFTLEVTLGAGSMPDLSGCDVLPAKVSVQAVVP